LFSLQVRLSGLRACVSVLRDLAEGDREHMKDTVPLMFGILETAFSTGDDETIVHAVTTLTDLAEVNNEGESDTGVAGGARFLRGHIQPILQAMATMAASSKLEPETRRVCFNFLILLAEVGKGMIRKQKEFAQRVIPLAFSFLTELQHSAAWESPTKVEEGDDDEDYENYKFGAQSMERLSHALGGKLTMSISKPIIDAALRDTNNWTLRHAALIAMSKIAMGCQKELGPHLNEIMANYVTAMALNDPNPRVQWAAIDLCGHLCEAFEPDFPNDQSEAIIQTLLACMQPQQHWRVIENACACLPEVGRTIDPEKLVPCMEHLLRALVPLLGMMQYPKVVERALGAVSTVAAVSHKAFIPYYDSFMPGVKGIIVSCTEAHQVRIRTRAIECIGMLAQAVEGEKFRPELDAIMQALLGMLAQGMPSDDPQHGEIVTTMARIARSVKQEFLPYLPQILPSIFKSARIDDACVIVNEGEANPYAGRNGWETVNVEARAVGKQTVSINTTLLEEKARAIRMLFEYCNTLGASFYPYAQDMANIVVPCLRYQHNQNVRENCTFALRPLMLCFKEALKNDPAAQQTQCSALFAFLWPQVILCMKVS
jgi:hypothetical protein